MNSTKRIIIFSLIAILLLSSFAMAQVRRDRSGKAEQVAKVKAETDYIIGKLKKHLPFSLRQTKMGKWTLKDPKPRAASGGGLSSTWQTSYDKLNWEIWSSVTPTTDGNQIIAEIRMIIPIKVGYQKARIHDLIISKYGRNTRVGSTATFIEYIVNIVRFAVVKVHISICIL